MRTRVLLATTVLVAACAAILLGGMLGGPVATSAARAERTPFVQDPLTQQGFAHQRLARETGDPLFTTRAAASFERALAAGEPSYLPTLGLAAAAASRHRFREARALARRALELAPGSAEPYGILGDAELELGRYPQAWAAFDRLAALKPTASAYARVSYARELLGDTTGAIAAMRLAVDAARGSAELAAWAQTQLANLYAGTGRPRIAARHYRAVLSRRGGYAPALAALGYTEWVLGRPEAAVPLYRRALASAPVPEYAVALGDLLAVLKRPEQAGVAYARAAALEDAFARNGGQNQLETALVDLDHDRNLREALDRAREGRRLRPSIEGDHVLAWALYKNGRCADARRYSQRALRLGTKDIGAIYHRSLIERCLGNTAAAERFLERVRVLDPYFLRVAPSSFRLR